MKITCSFCIVMVFFIASINPMENDPFIHQLFDLKSIQNTENMDEPPDKNYDDYTDFLARKFTHSVLPKKLQNIPPEYQCPYNDCYERPLFENKQLLYQHLTLHHQTNGKFPCPFSSCTKQPVSKKHLADHLRIHTRQKPFKCTVVGCSATFKQPNALNLHIKAKHIQALLCHESLQSSGLEDRTDDNNNHQPIFLLYFLAYQLSYAYLPETLKSPTIPCHAFYCPYTECHTPKEPTKNIFESRQLLLDHLHKHRKNYRLPCPFASCTSKRNHAAQLAIHVRTHIGHHPYQCPISGCNKTFSKNIIAHHIEKHHCPECNQYCKSPIAREKHIRNCNYLIDRFLR